MGSHPFTSILFYFRIWFFVHPIKRIHWRRMLLRHSPQSGLSKKYTKWSTSLIKSMMRSPFPLESCGHWEEKIDFRLYMYSSLFSQSVEYIGYSAVLLRRGIIGPSPTPCKSEGTTRVSIDVQRIRKTTTAFERSDVILEKWRVSGLGNWGLRCPWYCCRNGCDSKSVRLLLLFEISCASSSAEESWRISICSTGYQEKRTDPRSWVRRHGHAFAMPFRKRRWVAWTLYAFPAIRLVIEGADSSWSWALTAVSVNWGNWIWRATGLGIRLWWN